MFVTYKSEFHIIANKIDQIERSYKPIAMKVFKEVLLPHVKDQIKRFILDGGSSDPKYAWGYWKRIGHDWQYQSGKMSAFSNGWSGASVLPIHPTSFLARKMKRTPSTYLFALNDTTELMNSFTSISDYYTADGVNMFIGSTSFKLDYHEVTFKYKRKIIEPYSIMFAEDVNYHNYIMSKITTELEKI